jgi:hypothetical protein
MDTKIKDVFYGGTKEQWENINIIPDDYWTTNYDGLFSTTST